MWQIRRIRLDHIGAPAARFIDVTLDLTDTAGTPLDSILWLRNGGGKSTVLSLVCALIRPDRRDFLASGDTDKHLEDYVLGADTAHVIVEWSGPAGQVLVTGAVYEWADRTQPADPNKSYDRLEQRWYAFTPVAGRAALDVLPFVTAEGLRTPLKQFIATIREWDTITGTGAVVTDVRQRWAKALDDRGLDPDLFSAILKMNATEGGIENQFQFKTADQFVRYLLDLIVDPEMPREVAGILEKVRAGLAERPQIDADLTFASESVPLLHTFAGARDEHMDAERRLADVLSATRALRDTLLASTARAHADEVKYQADAADAAELQRTAKTEVDKAYNLATELRRVAAVYRLDAAQLEQNAANEAYTAAAAELDAWQAVARLTILARAEERANELEAQLALSESDAAPLRDRRDMAARRFAAVLDDTIGRAMTSAAQQQQRADDAAMAQQRAKTEWSEAVSDLARTRSREEELRRLLSALDDTLATAIADEWVREGEEVAVALDRHLALDAAAAVEEQQLDSRRAAIRHEREALDAAERAERAVLHAVETDLATMQGRLTDLDARVAGLADDPRLHLLSMTDVIEPVAEASDLVELLSAAIVQADRQRVELAVAGAEDERACAELGRVRLLPPPLDLVRALAVLDEAGIAATTGWAYLADAVPATSRAHALAAAPALAGGLLVYDPAELSRAQALLGSANLRPTSAVTVATTADLAAVTDSAAVHFVVPVAAALVDKDAADDELRLRDLARTDRATNDAELSRQQNIDRDLKDQVLRLAADCQPGTRETLRERIAELDSRREAATEGLAGYAANRERLREEESILGERAPLLAAERRRLTTVIQGVRELTARVTAAGPLRAELAGLPGLVVSIEERVARATGAEAAASTKYAAAVADRDHHFRLAAEGRSERAGLPDPAGADADIALDAARAAWRDADDAYRQQTSESVLAATAAEARRAVTQPRREVDMLEAAVRAHAERLFNSPGARDDAARERRTADAVRTVGAATDRVTATGVEVRLAEQERDQATPGDRPRRFVLDEPPPTRAAALAAAAAADAERERHQQAEKTAEEAVRTAQAHAAQARERETEFRHLVELLGPDDAIREPDLGAAAFDGSPADARTAVDTANSTLRGHRETVDEAKKHVDRAGHRILTWAMDDRFTSVTPEVRGRFRVEDVAAEIGPDAIALADELDLFAVTLRGRLAELDEHKGVVVTAMTGMVRQALKTLARAQSHSALPDSLPGWAGQRFLDVGPRTSIDTTDAVIRDRVARLVDQLSTRGVEVPRGTELLWQATASVVGDGNWRARVLKPSTNLDVDRVSVEKMRKWSGGEKVTISLLLFCMVAKLRAATRGRDLPGLGVLPLDNPLGKANYVVFLDLQRKVAAANGVQLLFLTGVGDMKAVGRFPNLVRLSNTPNRGREYVRVADRQVSADDPLGIVDHTRIWRDDPVLKLL
jgi:hypothetical protein